VLLTINGACFLLLVWALAGNAPEILKWLATIILVYLVLDFVYLSLTYPKRPFAEYLELFRGEKPE
jgi:hypothetical protein